MLSVLCRAPGQLELIERPKPSPKPGEVLVRVRRVGVCGTDIHIFQGNQPYFEYPRVMGHELSGEIAEAPKGSDLKPGDRVYIVPYLHCGRCIACVAGKTNCCTSLRVLGVHIDGGMCEYLALPSANVIKAEDISLDQAAMVEFLAIGAHAVSRAKIKAGQRVLVAGAGPIGVGLVLFAKFAGAAVTVIDGRDDRLEFCRRHLGVDSLVRLGADDVTQLSELSGGEFFHNVFDATGSPKAMERGFSLVAHGGNYVLVSIVQANISFADPEFHKREMTLLSSRNATPADFEMVVVAMRDGKIPAAAINTHRAPLAEIPRRMPEWIAPEAGTIKALLEIP